MVRKKVGPKELERERREWNQIDQEQVRKSLESRLKRQKVHSVVIKDFIKNMNTAEQVAEHLLSRAGLAGLELDEEMAKFRRNIIINQKSIAKQIMEQEGKNAMEAHIEAAKYVTNDPQFISFIIEGLVRNHHLQKAAQNAILGANTVTQNMNQGYKEGYLAYDERSRGTLTSAHIRAKRDAKTLGEHALAEIDKGMVGSYAAAVKSEKLRTHVDIANDAMDPKKRKKKGEK